MQLLGMRGANAREASSLAAGLLSLRHGRQTAIRVGQKIWGL